MKTAAALALMVVMATALLIPQAAAARRFQMNLQFRTTGRAPVFVAHLSGESVSALSGRGHLNLHITPGPPCFVTLTGSVAGQVLTMHGTLVPPNPIRQKCGGGSVNLAHLPLSFTVNLATGSATLTLPNFETHGSAKVETNIPAF